MTVQIRFKCSLHNDGTITPIPASCIQVAGMTSILNILKERNGSAYARLAQASQFSVTLEKAATSEFARTSRSLPGKSTGLARPSRPDPRSRTFLLVFLP